MLVGENSTGKSTFLAVCSLLPYLLQPESINFNRSPFVLGSYRNIATKRSDETDNADSFEIGLDFDISPPYSPNFTKDSTLDSDMQLLLEVVHDEGESKHCRIITRFAERNGQPHSVISSIMIGKYRFEIDWSITNGNKIKKLAHGTDVVHFGDLDNSPQIAHFRFPIESDRLNWNYTIEEIIKRSFPSQIPESFQSNNLEIVRSYFSQLLTEIRSQTAYALAPIRSTPKRTYDPVQTQIEPSGSHVPMVLSKLSRENTEKWKSLREIIGAFGKRSGLYGSISVRNLGISPSDPFQLEVSVDGNRVNLLDVGYGVSQILPIIVDSVTLAWPRRFLFQQPEVHLHPQGHVALATFLVDRIAKTTQDFVIESHSDHLIDQLRIEIRDRKLDPNVVSLLYFENDRGSVQIHEIEIDRLGNLKNAPNSYRRFFLNHQYELLGMKGE